MTKIECTLVWTKRARGSDSSEYTSGSYLIDSWPSAREFRFGGRYRILYRSVQFAAANTVAEAKQKAELHAASLDDPPCEPDSLIAQGIEESWTSESVSEND